MILTPVIQDNMTWNLADDTGKTVKRGFVTKARARSWAEQNGHSVFETGGDEIEQAGEGRF